MSQTLTSLLVHLVFSTKNREPLITADVEPQLFAYMGGILRNYQSRLLDAGGDRDHVHLLVSQSKNIALSNLLKEVKGDSSLWIKSQGRAFRNFHWQDGYGAFSFGLADLPALQKYVSTQKSITESGPSKKNSSGCLRKMALNMMKDIFGIKRKL